MLQTYLLPDPGFPLTDHWKAYVTGNPVLFRYEYVPKEVAKGTLWGKADIGNPKHIMLGIVPRNYAGFSPCE